MKRIQAACLFQTLLFSQKEDLGLTAEQARALNRREADSYKMKLERTGTRYRITEETEMSDGSILIRIRKQYNEKADVEEYFSL